MTDTVRSLENQALLDGAMKLAASRHRKRDHDMSTCTRDRCYIGEAHTHEKSGPSDTQIPSPPADPITAPQPPRRPPRRVVPVRRMPAASS